jgi:2-hydroxychromene-2-carboxylate isomerase
VFGVPSFVSGGELFFGNDRLDVLAWRLKRDRL